MPARREICLGSAFKPPSFPYQSRATQANRGTNPDGAFDMQGKAG